VDRLVAVSLAITRRLPIRTLDSVSCWSWVRHEPFWAWVPGWYGDAPLALTLRGSHPFASVGSTEVECRPDRHDASRIDVVMRHVVVALDVIEIHCLRDAGLLIQIEQVSVKVFVIDDTTDVALEVPVIDGIETHQRAEESPVGLDESRIEKKAPCT